VSALVRFATVEEAIWVVDNLNGNLPDGLLEPILCKFASSGGNRPLGGGKGGQPSPPLANHAITPSMPAMTGVHANGFVDPKTNVWIGDLPPTFTQAQCEQVFGAYGSIVECRVTPALPGRNSSALIRFATPEEAAWIADNLNGNLPEGLDAPVIVKIANGPRNQQSAQAAVSPWGSNRSQPYSGGDATKGWGKNGKGGKGDGLQTGTFQTLYGAVKAAGLLGSEQAVPIENQLHVKNLPPDTTDAGLLQLFSVFGPLAPMKSLAMLNPDGTCKGVGFVDFLDAASAQAASAALDNFALPDGTVLGVTVKRAGKKGDGKSGGKWGGGKGGGSGGTSWTAAGPDFA